MKFPNRDNIDRWLFDFSEGNLSAEQEALLENYLLNNPDLEIDLDAWQDAKVPQHQVVYAEKETLLKKRRIAPFFWFSAASVLLIVAISLFLNSESNDLGNSTLTSNIAKKAVKASRTAKKSHQSNVELENAIVDNKQFSTVENEINTTNYIGENLASQDLGNSNKVDELDGVENSSSYPTSNSWNRLAELKLKTPENLDFYQIRGQELITSEDIAAAKEKAVINFSSPKIIQKIERVLSKETALSNVPDYQYALPEISAVDANFSSIGSTSQTRFLSTSRARWLENTAQQKLSQQISLDGYARELRSGLGMQANYDHFGNGVIQNWNVALLYSPKIALGRFLSFEPTMRFKMGNKLLNSDRVVNQSQVEFQTGQVNQFNFDTSVTLGRRLWYRDVDLGFTMNAPMFYLGFQANNLMRHDQYIYSNLSNNDERRIAIQYNAVLGTQYLSKSGKFTFSPYIFANWSVSNHEIFGGFSSKFKKLMIGGSYSTRGNLTGLIGLTGKHVSLFAQTAYLTTATETTKSLTHQVTLRFNSKMSRKARRYITL